MRFQREAEVLASLNHPNIAIIHGLEKSDGVTGIVMELVEGRPSRTALHKAPFPSTRHCLSRSRSPRRSKPRTNRGIIHRDLKPANIKVRPDGVCQSARLRVGENDGIRSRDCSDHSGYCRDPGIHGA